MLNYSSVIDLQIFITPCKNIREVFHKADIPLFDFWTEHFLQSDDLRIFLSTNVAILYILIIRSDFRISGYIIFIKNIF
jgi:hypothetical protein